MTRLVHDGSHLVGTFGGTRGANDFDYRWEALRSFAFGDGLDTSLAMVHEPLARSGGLRGIDADRRATFHLLRTRRGDVSALVGAGVGTSGASGASGSGDGVVEWYDYDAWGRWTVRTPGSDGHWGTSDDTFALDGRGAGADGVLFSSDDELGSGWGNVFGFTGRWWDGNAGAWQVRARWYRPDWRRWLSPDPLGTIDGPNRYAYAGHNPLRYVDPSGLGKQRDSGERSHHLAQLFGAQNGKALRWVWLSRWSIGAAERRRRSR
ncbi:MAG: RHS repeat-associated core domain-containing protein [Planctomycetota bacterium]